MEGASGGSEEVREASSSVFSISWTLVWMIISSCDGMTLLCYKYLLDKHQKQLDDTDLVYCCQKPKAILFRLLQACQISHLNSQCDINMSRQLCVCNADGIKWKRY